MAAYDQVVAALPLLTSEERGKIAERLKMLNALAPGKSLVSSPDSLDQPSAGGIAEELLDAICATVLQTSGEKIAPFGLRRAPQFRSFKEKAQALEGFLHKHALTRSERRALLHIAIGLLYDVIREEGHPAAARTIMAQVHRLPAVLDWQFPGYAAAGCLRLIVKSATRDISRGA
jgi:hypothetical protein